MKTTLLSILLCLTPVLATTSRAEEEKSDAPREEEKEEAKPRERMREERARFQEETKKHMQEAMKKAAQLAAEGKPDEAEDVRRQAKEKRQAAIEERRRAMQSKMRDRHPQAGPGHQGDRMERERGHPLKREQRGAGPEGPVRPRPHPDGPPRGEMVGKLHHVQQAIRHLREAGLPDPAENLERLAQRLCNALHDHDGPRPEGPRRDADLDALRREVQELKQAVREMCDKACTEGTEHPEEKEDDENKHH